jgi:hypothetical protein
MLIQSAGSSASPTAIKLDLSGRLPQARSSPPSVAMRPRLPARSQMSSASWLVGGGFCRTRFGRSIRRHASGFPPFDPVREAVARAGNALRTGLPIATFHCAAPARCGAFADECASLRRQRPIADAKRSFSPPGLCGSSAAVGRVPPLGIPSNGGHQIIDERARPWSRRSPAGVPVRGAEVPTAVRTGVSLLQHYGARNTPFGGLLFHSVWL